MRYLFFDIEASDGINMCSFGYVVTNEQFDVLETKDILMNPKAPFLTGLWEKESKTNKFTLAYPEEVFTRRGAFPTVYKDIKDIFDSCDYVFGFSVRNDVQYVLTACERYKLPKIDYKFFDIQALYAKIKKINYQKALETMAIELGININDITLHLSRDDAYLSMLILKEICKQENLDLTTISEKYPSVCGETKSGEIYLHNMNVDEIFAKRHKEFVRRTLNAFETKMNNQAKGNVNIYLTQQFKDSNVHDTLVVITKLIEKGYKLTQKTFYADLYLNCTAKANGTVANELYEKKVLIPRRKTKVINKKELYSIIGLTKGGIRNFHNKEIDQVEEDIKDNSKDINKQKKAFCELFNISNSGPKQ